jgi:hypothetical protein
MGGEHHEPAVHPVELFSDLVFVVALNITARLLEESADLVLGIWLYGLRIFMLWYLWASMMSNSDLVSSFNTTFQPIHYVANFLFMAGILFMVRAFAADEHGVAFGWHFFAEAASIALNWYEVSKPKPTAMADAVYKFHREVVFQIIPVVVPVIEILPIAAAYYFISAADAEVATEVAVHGGATPSHHRTLSAADAGAETALPVASLLAWSAFPVLVFVGRVVIPGLCISSEPPYKAHHASERYELIMLIFTCVP